MGFFSKIRKRIKKIIPKEIRPFVPYMAAFLPGGMGLTGKFAQYGGDKFLKAALARGLTDDEAGLKDMATTGILAAAPTAIGEGLQLGSVNAELAGKMKMANYLDEGAQAVKGLSALKTIGGQGAIDYGMQAAELNEDALERYNRELLEQGIADKAGRRAAIRAIYEGTGTWDMGEVDEMLDTYGYRTGGRVGLDEGGMPWEKRSSYKFDKKKKKKGKKWDAKKERWVDSDEGKDFFDSLDAAKEGYDKLEELNTIKPLPIRELRLASGGDVDDEVMEFDEELITPEYLMKEEGVEIGEQVSSPDRMDELNALSMDLFGKPLGELNEIQMEMLMNFASQKASGYSQDELDMYEQYKYDMNEQRPGMPIMSIDEFLQMELGAARAGVATGGLMALNPNEDVEVMDAEEIITPDYLMKEEGVAIGPMAGGGDRGWRAQMLAEQLAEEQYGKEFYDLSQDQQMEIYTIALDMIDSGGMKKGGPVKKPRVKSIGVGKAKDYPGIKKILEMNKKGRKRYADGGLMNLGGNEMDLRGGGFVPMGAKERADDVPARLSKNEFVMTADAVRGAGGGSVQKGADLMYDTMKTLEARG